MVGYERQQYYNLISDNIQVYLERDLLRQDMDNQIWETISSKLVVKPTYEREWITKELDLDDDDVTVTITTKKGKKMNLLKN